ncbi:MAG: multidrug ABC transporter ATPase [Microcella sp.]
MSNRVERVLAYMVASIIVLSLAAFIALIVGTAVGLERDDFAQGIWPTITILPLIGLPIGFVLIIVLLVVSAVRRGRAARDAGQ